MSRVVVALCFIPIHSLNPLLWGHLNAPRATVPDFEMGLRMTKINFATHVSCVIFA